MFFFDHCFRFQLLVWILFLTYQALFIWRVIRQKFENNDSAAESRLLSDRNEELRFYFGRSPCATTDLAQWRRCTKVKDNSTSWLTFAPIGRTGNRMYEYAGTVGIALRRRMLPAVPRNTNLERCFRILESDHVPEGVGPFVEEHPPDLFYPETGLIGSGDGHVRLNSLLQSWKYFGHADEMIRSVFEFRPESIAKADEFLKSGRTYPSRNESDPVYVSIQVRRTDFVNTYGSLIKPISPAYIRDAMSKFRQIFGHLVRFVVVSDDPEWCRKHINISRSDLISTDRSGCDDLAILARCNHSILTAGSSFGWWGAYLANGHVTYYPGWLKSGSWYNLKYVESDFFPPRWTRLDF